MNPDGSVELLASEIAGHTLAGPNDLAFGPDGRLWFTESGTEQDDRVEVPATGKLFVLDSSGGGEMLLERPNVYPNGIAFDEGGILYWTESMAHRVCRLDDGQADDLLPAERRARAGRDGVRRRRPAVRVHDDLRRSDGAVARGRDPRGDLARRARTNCIFDGPTLYVTATKVSEIHAEQRTGTFWRVETDATGGLPLIPGKL